MSAMVPDSAIELTGFSVHRSDRTKELTGKSRGGGVCFYINNLWCDERNIHSIKSFCSPDLEFHMLLCRPFWLPRKFTAIIITAVYIPPQANTDQALRDLYRNISEQETAHPDAAFVITGDFNKANFRTIAPKYFQHVTIMFDVRSALSVRTSAYKSGNSDDRKQASYDLRRSIKAAKRTYKNKVEEHFNNNNPRSMWQGINNITGFKGNKPATVNIAASLPARAQHFLRSFRG